MARLASFAVRVRLLFVNDGSTDGTLQVLMGLSSSWMRSRSLPRAECRKAEAVRRGLLHGVGLGASIVATTTRPATSPRSCSGYSRARGATRGRS